MPDTLRINLQEPPSNLDALIWAKSQNNGEQSLPLWAHLDDAACVADLLWDNFLSHHTRNILADDCGSIERARKLAIFLAGGHDIGKASPHFTMQVGELKRRLEDAGAIFHHLDKSSLRPHSLVSAQSLHYWLSQQGKTNVALPLALIVGGHHGVYPASIISSEAKGLGKTEASLWHEIRQRLWNRAAATAGIKPEDFDFLAQGSFRAESQLILTGFIIVSDWIASNTDLFPLEVETNTDNRLRRARHAIQKLQLPKPWRPNPPDSINELFRTRFDFPDTATPRPVQESAAEIASSLESPGLMIIEAPTGEGKTEAALAAAEIFADRFQLGGLAFALPTCATSDAMFPRLLSWLDTTISPDQQASAILSHGKAEFNEDYKNIFPRRYNNFSPLYDESSGSTSSSVTAHWWLRGRKTSVLADFTIGTIDQILFAALASKHVMLRYLGLSGKVIIFDEIHSSDHYMSVYLNRILEWLGAMNCPVIALSATLAPRKRAQLIQSYRRGVMKRAGERYNKKLEQQDEKTSLAACGYPLITTVTTKGITFTAPEQSSRSSTTKVEFIGDDTDDVCNIINKVFAQGNGCIAVVRNTINRAQKTFQALKETLDGVEVILLHSKFIGPDRRATEKMLTTRLGKNASQRPHKLVVVATQVIEQSLDVDFDLMLSDIAPIDLIIQRIGRLHRHESNQTFRQPALANPLLFITGTDLKAATPNQLPQVTPALDKDSAHVYGESSLLRCIATLFLYARTDSLRICSPDDIAALVSTADEPHFSAPRGWEEKWNKAENAEKEKIIGKKNRARGFLVPSLTASSDLLSWANQRGNASEEPQQGYAQVRDSEENIEVILVQHINGTIRTLPWLKNYPSEQVDFATGIDSEVARATAQCSVQLPTFLANNSHADKIISELEKNGIESWQNSHWLKGQLPLILDENLCATVSNFTFIYDPETGLHYKQQKKD
ncbi:putative CRISPR-associated helicase Cas3 family protein [Corynebacterium kutscheri]|uniref:CRISPR-associated helicase Cas3 family protein n=1 Tax=Corynebacterium kutscheri TaxID=35755 RepID=A0A0F6TDM7_9CORY|nr:CRISPR-associated helicase/endonuclease Cas3 [Corynebacterium kutscheri]AKE41061.1 CRISPR-associated helicase Cas3/CRISPR-associated endonuclease Cas3-HD [Corynebacterium kutscheri]VEH06950.1 putative CRISPR-associated helicase Cas3 family protein [Corynebacterium kutscheri]VEH09363.1 putative CRISPR-associated helicase Cas3 family protein [Corynebacterium kutscheri]VEH79445.1 putative CRISPR-associated helicase Cas3 family protein [Corynebacterium kutscheri]